MTDIKVTQADKCLIWDVRQSENTDEAWNYAARHRIEAQRPLLEALENMLVWDGRNPPSWVLEKANAAIKQAKGE